MQRQEGEKEVRVQPNYEEMEEDSSEWSLASLEELKSLNLRDLEAQEEGIQSHQKQKETVQVEVKFPVKPTFLPNAALHLVGRVILTVGELLIVESGGGSFVVDLDNWLSDEHKGLIGFVIDVMGKVEKPYYVVRPEVVSSIQAFQGQSLYYIEGSSKILQDEDIKSMKSKSALDAEEEVESSSDEEPRVQRDFSEEKFERKKTPPRRVNKFKQSQQGEGFRDRTRQNFRGDRNANRSRNEQNQRYLNSVYSMHYDQMMRLYNGQFDAQNPPPLQNPYQNYNRQMPQPFGNQFYSQVFPTQQSQQLQHNSQTQQNLPQQPIFPQQGLFGFSQTPQNPQNPQGLFGGPPNFNSNRKQ